MDKIYNLIVDTKLKTYQKIYGMKQFENNVVLNIQLVQNGTPLDLTGCTVRLNYQNKNEVLLQMANIIDETKGKVRVTVLTKVLDTIGDTPVDISVFDEHQKKITSSTFVLVVQESIYSNDKIDEEELDLIQDIYSKEKERQEAETQRESNEKKREENDKIRDEKIAKIEKDCQECKEEVNTQIHKFDTQEEERKANEIERMNNENARKTDEQQRVKQENAREENEKVRVTSETKRVESMDTIEKEWEEIKKDLGSQGGTGDMMKAVYDKNNDGIVDEAYNSARLDNTPASMYIKKEDNTTWQNININPSIDTGDTPTISLKRPSPTDKVLLEPFNANFTTIDDVINRLGYGGLITVFDKSLTDITTSGVYIVDNLKNAPDIPPINKRRYLVKSYIVNASINHIIYDVYSLGTGKKYTYNSLTDMYCDIPCRVPNHPTKFYIDPINGSDQNSGDESNHIRTFKCLESRIPKILNEPIEIVLTASADNSKLTLQNITVDYSNSKPNNVQRSAIIIRGTSSNIVLDKLELNNIQAPSDIEGITVQDLTVKITWVYNCNPILFTRVYSKFHVDNGYGEFTQCSGQYYADHQSAMLIREHKNDKYTFPHVYGIVSSHMSRVIYSGTKPTGDSTDTVQKHGGVITEE